jgi:NAD(P)H-flavin reductase
MTQIPLQKFKAKVSEHELLAGKYQYIYLELLDPHKIEFSAGQYVLMTIPGIEKKYSYSISSSPAKDHGIELLVDISPGGDGSLFLASLAPGDEVEFMAPVGHFFIENSPEIAEMEKNLTFIATGSGISAVRSMILDLLEDKNDPRPIKLHWGLRYIDELFWEEDFRLLAESFNNFKFDLVLSRPPEKWPLCSGRVTDCLTKHSTDFSGTGFYLCGNQEMIKQVTEILLIKSVNKANIHSEKFY